MKQAGSSSRALPAQHGPAAAQLPTRQPSAALTPAPHNVHSLHLGGFKQLSDAQLLSFERQGFLVAHKLLNPTAVTTLKKEAERIVADGQLAALQQRVRVLCPTARKVPDTVQEAMQLLKRHGTDEVGFLQFFNSWRHNPVLRGLVMSEVLAGAAAQLLGVSHVRLYQDCIFMKKPGFSTTNWHSDLRMAPFDTNAFVMAWIPLRPIGCQTTVNSGQKHDRRVSDASNQKVQRGQGRQSAGQRGHKAASHRPVQSPDELQDSGLLFAAGSHRDFALPFWHDLGRMDLSTRGYKICDTGPMELGDVSFHHGWTLHAAGPQSPNTPPRMALAVGYFADGARLLRKGSPSVRQHLLHNEDEEGYASWLPDLKDGALARHEHLPLAYPQAGCVDTQ